MHCLLILGVMLSFASYYGDHMVLQKEPAGAVVWGYGEPGAAVTVTLSRDGGLIVTKKMVQVKGRSWTLGGQLGPVVLVAEEHVRAQIRPAGGVGAAVRSPIVPGFVSPLLWGCRGDDDVSSSCTPRAVLSPSLGDLGGAGGVIQQSPSPPVPAFAHFDFPTAGSHRR